MNRPKIKNIYKKAWGQWGEDAQLNVLMEECAELIQAVSKYKRYPHEMSTRGRALAEEIADVEIMIDQLKEHMDYLNLKVQVENNKYEKLLRLDKKLNEMIDNGQK